MEHVVQHSEALPLGIAAVLLQLPPADEPGVWSVLRFLVGVDVVAWAYIESS
jgi:hypothetical protein